ncbi:MAG: gfo/Idh/MocA family oxidoreductase, partial [Clostridia bacterium]|nr:gfo/Idh/MocA family oxidoreductase [Clostridia bacterium]
MKKSKLNIGVIGHGQRGKTILNLLCNMDDVNVIGVCELYEDRLEAAKHTVIEKQGKEPFATLDYHEL